MGLNDWFKGLRKPAVVSPRSWDGSNRRAAPKQDKVIDCPVCGVTVSSWKTYADGTRYCLDCSVKGAN